jgi:hypothetical protein
VPISRLFLPPLTPTQRRALEAAWRAPLVLRRRYWQGACGAAIERRVVRSLVAMGTLKITRNGNVVRASVAKRLREQIRSTSTQRRPSCTTH